MNMIKHLQLPLSEDEARSLNVGDMVTVSGRVFTGRSRFHIRAVEEGILPPIDFSEINAFFHVGPVMLQKGDAWEVVSVEPTSSIRFERYGADVVRKLKLRTLIGKTTMGPVTAKALCEVGGVYLTKIGLCGNLLRDQIKKVKNVYFLDELGKTEATWIFEVERFGPFFVAIDSHGKNYFEDLSKDVEDKMPGINVKLGIPNDYFYTDVNSSVGK